MREFLIQNEKGQTLPLQGGSVFFYDPSGLGFGNANKYAEVDGFFIATEKKIQQTERNGTLLFQPTEAYSTYAAFSNFLLQAEKLTLAYKPTDEWYYCDIDVRNVAKTELTRFRALEVPVTFSPTSPWYSVVPIEAVISGKLAGNIKRYDYRYDYIYSDQTRPAEISLTLDAQLPGDMEISFIGPINGPTVTAYDENNNIIGKVNLSQSSASDGQSLEYSSRGNNAGVYKNINGTATNIINEVVLTAGMPTFFKIPANQQVTLILSAADLADVKVIVKAYRYYRTV